MKVIDFGRTFKAFARNVNLFQRNFDHVGFSVTLEIDNRVVNPMHPVNANQLLIRSIH